MRLPTIAIIGPTCCNKTEVSLCLGASLRCEIISVDSVMVYRGLDIGSAKPSRAQQRQVPHHLISVCDPSDSYSAAAFIEDALRLIDDIKARGAIPLLVGGSVFYFVMLDTRPDALAGKDTQTRRQLERQEARHGVAALYQELLAVDPRRAAMLHENDAYRIKRALEIYRLTGKPASAWAQKTDKASRISARFCLRHGDRQTHRAKIEERLDNMLDKGFVEEVCALMARGDLDLSMPALRAVGYRQLWEYLKGEHNYKDTRARIVAASGQLLKRQTTWLKRIPDLRYYEVDRQPIARIAAKIVDSIQSMVE